MKARLFSKTGALAGTEFFIDNQATIGRDASCDIVLYPHTISSQHARIFRDETADTYFLEDLGSSNGTRIDKTLVQSPVKLGALHVITLAKDIDLIFQTYEGELPKAIQKDPNPGLKTEMQSAFAPPPGMPAMEPEDQGLKTTFGQKFDEVPNLPAALPGLPQQDTRPPTPPEEPQPEPDDHTLPPVAPLRNEPSPDETLLQIPDEHEEVSIEEYFLVVQSANGSVKRLPLLPGESIIGRLAECDITLEDEYISGRHAKITVSTSGVVLEDLGSRNKTLIQNEPISTPVSLERGAIFMIGPTTKAVLQ